MLLDSYLEIFMTFYGWAFANLIGEILVGTGLIALPFAIMVFNTWHSARTKGQGFEGVRGLLEAMQTKIITALFVMSMCVATTPITSLNGVRMSYQPKPTLDNPDPKPVEAQQIAQTEAGKALGDAIGGQMSKAGNLSYVPLWWYSMMAITSGINGAFKAGLYEHKGEVRMLEEMARTSTIEDSKLLREIQRFYSECFAPARSQYLLLPKEQLTPQGQAIVSMGNKDYGPTDADWIGSQLFRTEPGFYQNMRSYNPVPGWSIDFTRDVEYIQTPAPEGDPHHGYVNPDWGRPTCKQWWEDETRGVRRSMIEHASSWRTMATKATAMLGSDDKGKDMVAKLAQTQADPQYVSPDSFLGAQHDAGTVAARAVGGIVSTGGTGILALLTNVTVVPLHNGLMMMQAMVLMTLYMFLPLVTFLSGYDLRAMLLGALAIFTVKFWGVMWYVVNWIDGHLISAMYPPGGFDTDFLVQTLQNGHKRMLLNVLLLTMYVGMPAIWTGLMAMIGIHSADTIAGLTSASKTADSATPRKR